jgi:lycopene beta-cyclase
MANRRIISVDFLFIGLGAANCLLLKKMFKNGMLGNKKIAIIEPDNKDANDRTFCFWSTQEELEKLGLEDLVSSTWNNIKVSDREKQCISPLSYYHIKGIDLYNEAKNNIKNLDVSIFPISYAGEPRIDGRIIEIDINETTIIANNVYDSRPPLFTSPNKNESHLLQSFFGWKIETSEKLFDVSTAVMMDFDIAQNNCCQFMYVLPFSDNTALFEVTRFGSEKISLAEAEIILKDYLERQGFAYKIIEVEKGIIPMSSAQINHDAYATNWIYTGGRANMIKPSTGYAFHSMAIDAHMHAESINNKELYVRASQKQRFKFYDRLLLKILEKSPSEGKKIFETLFKNIPAKEVLTFLNEKTKFKNEILIFSKLPILLFLKFALKDIFHKISTIAPYKIALAFTIISLFFSTIHIEKALWLLLGSGFLTVGLSHGALDHLVDNNIKHPKQLLKYSIIYLIKGSLLGLVWLILPDMALIVFIAYTGWHFGQADFNQWRLKQGIISFLWGLAVLFTILTFHFQETLDILSQIPGLKFNDYKYLINENQIVLLKSIVLLFTIALIALKKSQSMLLTFAYLIVSSMLPLLFSFGIYFVLQHSLHGWSHLKSDLKMSSYHLWLKSLPFSVMGALIFAAFMLTNSKEYLGVFFIILSCISIPHVLSMNRFYDFRIHK